MNIITSIVGRFRVGVLLLGIYVPFFALFRLLIYFDPKIRTALMNTPGPILRGGMAWILLGISIYSMWLSLGLFMPTQSMKRKATKFFVFTYTFGPLALGITCLALLLQFDRPQSKSLGMVVIIPGLLAMLLSPLCIIMCVRETFKSRKLGLVAKTLLVIPIIIFNGFIIPLIYIFVSSSKDTHDAAE